MATVKPQNSETLWFALALVIFSAVGDVVSADSFKAIVGENFGWIGTGVGLVVAWLRFKTTKPIEVKKNLGKLDEGDWDEE